MTSLPQRKKSAEEIAKLRETLGVPSSPAANSALSPSPADREPEQDLFAKEFEGPDMKSTVLPEFKKIISSNPNAIPDNGMPVFEAGSAPEFITSSKRVSSLKKSEQGPVRVQKPTNRHQDSPIPVQKRSAEEIERLRKLEAMERMNAAPPAPRLLPAHPIMIAPGYILVGAGALCFVVDNYPWIATAACALAAMLHALLLLLMRPLSRHHAGFIACMILLLIVFGALHHFPQLHHAS